MMNVSFSAQAPSPRAIIMIVGGPQGLPDNADMMAATSNFMQDVRRGAQSVVGNVSQSDARLNRLA